MKKFTSIILMSLFIQVLFSLNASSQSNNDISIYKFDGFKLGDNFGEIMKLSPYDMLCDNDPIDNGNRSFMCYGALPCRNRTFPKETTVIFYLKYSEENLYNQPIEAFAYLYGSYFNDKTNFPLKPGDNLKLAKKKFGEEKRTFEISRKEFTLNVSEFANNIYAIYKQENIIGFVLGKMPFNPMNEQWRGLMQMYQRYTPKE